MSLLKDVIKPVMASILIAPDPVMRENILSGVKRITIREGFRVYKEGLAMICCHVEPCCPG